MPRKWIRSETNELWLDGRSFPSRTSESGASGSRTHLPRNGHIDVYFLLTAAVLTVLLLLLDGIHQPCSPVPLTLTLTLPRASIDSDQLARALQRRQDKMPKIRKRVSKGESTGDCVDRLRD